MSMHNLLVCCRATSSKAELIASRPPKDRPTSPKQILLVNTFLSSVISLLPLDSNAYTVQRDNRHPQLVDGSLGPFCCRLFTRIFQDRLEAIKVTNGTGAIKSILCHHNHTIFTPHRYQQHMPSRQQNHIKPLPFDLICIMGITWT